MDLEKYCKIRKKIAVSYSGGINSIYMAHMLSKYTEVTAYYARTAFKPSYEVEEIKKTAAFSNIPLKIIDVDILNEKSIIANSADRCYHCRKYVLKRVVDAAYQDGYDNVADGTSASDNMGDISGRRALKELGIESPLLICGITNSEILQGMKDEGIPFEGNCESHCMATNLQLGKEITSYYLEGIKDVDTYLYEDGFRGYKLNVYDDRVRLQLKTDEFGKFFRKRDIIASKMTSYFMGAELDLIPIDAKVNSEKEEPEAAKEVNAASFADNPANHNTELIGENLINNVDNKSLSEGNTKESEEDLEDISILDKLSKIDGPIFKDSTQTENVPENTENTENRDKKLDDYDLMMLAGVEVGDSKF